MKLRAWTRNRWLLGAFAILVALDLAGGVASASIAVAAGSVHASQIAGGTTSSAETIAWANASRSTTDPNYPVFQNLSVSVAQTANLTDQGLNISWTGGKATPPQDEKEDYLQIMQCWGDPDNGPTPQQCEWGEPSPSLVNLVGSNAASRQLVQGEDPNQSYGNAYRIQGQDAWEVPFNSADGTSSFDPTTYFSAADSNEVTVARTGQDGTGSYDFDVQTSLSAPWLGCGAPTFTSTGIAGKSCWLVVVPRGEFNANGTAASSNSDARISGSPLSATNWADRIQFKLGFSAIGAACPLGRAEQRTAGTELIAGAFTSWQTALCARGTTYGYSEIGDGEARTDLLSGIAGAPGLAFMSAPIDATTATGSTLTYAPVSESALVIAYNIDENVPSSTAPNYALNGTAVPKLVLTPRLIAKLLTQSYKSDVPGSAIPAVMKNNPVSLRNDPEFLRLNPDFKSFPNNSAPDGLMVALGATDAASQVWDWLRSDADARDFLNGVSDPNGMVINPTYKALGLGTDTTVDSYPKADLSTGTAQSSSPASGYGTLDLRPYTLDMDDAATRTLKADAGIKLVWDNTKSPPAFGANGAQPPGARFELSLTDSSSAALYGLQTAEIVDSAGNSIPATTSTVTAGVASMVASGTPGVLINDPNAIKSGAYPLSMLTYAAVNICGSSMSALKAYKGFLNFADGAGQDPGDTPGDLPPGYIPLNSSLLAQDRVAVKAIGAEISSPQCPSHQNAASADTTTTTTTDSGGGTVAEPTPSPTPTSTKLPKPRLTPTTETTATRFTILAALLFAAPCLSIGPVLLRRRIR